MFLAGSGVSGDQGTEYGWQRVQVRRRCGYVIAPRLFPREQRCVEIGRRRGEEEGRVDGTGRWDGTDR